MATPRPWAINGKVHIGWRIDSLVEQDKTGLDFVVGPVAIVPELEDAQLIVRAVNEFVEAEEPNNGKA